MSSIPTGTGDRRLSCFAPAKTLKTGGAGEMGVTSCLIQTRQKANEWLLERHEPSSATRAHPEAGFAITQQDMSQRISAVPNAISNPIVDIQRGYSCGHVGYTVD